mmetsp:Transcript_23241/g.26648  ORF Transcript_23241/g.26648 Transcript_23241/m.26648 type:complete len:212 (+) Transcript_23241:1-636(+)
MISKEQSSNTNGENSESVHSVKYCPSTEFIAVPSFLLKTYEIISDPAFDDIVSWNKTGDAFIITKTNDFCEKVLPLYFKHKNFSSFVRQLNMYGFRKTKYKNNEQCFTHRFFKKDNKKLLLEMRRKVKEKTIEKKQTVDPYVKSSEYTKTINEMKAKIRDQDKRISQLLKINKEFKNSVLALYTELEKSKERNRNTENSTQNFASLMQGTN